MKDRVVNENYSYWIKRAPSYSKVNQEELNGVQNKKWSDFLERVLTKQFKNVPRNEINILDIGAGPAFISIILTKLGYTVTALDFAETMLEQGKINAGNLAKNIKFVQGDAQNLEFANESFDVVLSRNLTWNLENPDVTYKEWNRVLKKNGMLLNFDANWYHYLFDEKKRAAYEQDRKNVADYKIEDYNIGENFDVMEKIATELPLSQVLRPQWDEKCLEKLGMNEIDTDVDVWKEVWSEEEKINFSATPMFLVSGRK